MNHDRAHDPSPSTSPLSDRQALSLLREGFSGPQRPVDDLIERLERSDSEQWFGGAVSRLQSWVDFPLEGAITGALTLDQAEELKDASKRRMVRESSADARLAGLLGYFVAVAVALAHHGRLIASRSREEVDHALVDLADGCPQPWRALLQDAALRER